eukprot:Skav236148  [mRNA]  locus=scaffold2146:157220:171958:+ [translate_table: standard]
MGGIIAVSYEARAKGVTRQMSGYEAKKVCPEIILVQVPTAFGKADLQIYKAWDEAGDAVVELLAQKCDATEKRSVDEVAIDITGESQRLLSQLSSEELWRRGKAASHLADSALSKAAAHVTRSHLAGLACQVESMLGFTCSGGVATNKILAKLGCGLHKPNQQAAVQGPSLISAGLKDYWLGELTGELHRRYQKQALGQGPPGPPALVFSCNQAMGQY